MSKRFTAIPKPKKLSAENIEAYEKSGAGHDRVLHDQQNHNPANVVSPPIALKRLSLDLPETMHRRFKTACSAADVKMAGELVAFIEQRTQELEQQLGITHKAT